MDLDKLKTDNKITDEEILKILERPLAKESGPKKKKAKKPKKKKVATKKDEEDEESSDEE